MQNVKLLLLIVVTTFELYRSKGKEILVNCANKQIFSLISINMACA